MSELRQLIQLQKMDTEIAEKMSRLREVLAAQKESPEMRAARVATETAESELASATSARKKLSHELEDLNSKAKRSEERLYSGNVKNPKELSDLHTELESLGRRRDELEDQLLEAMMVVEDAQAVFDEAQGGLKRLEDSMADDLPQLKAEQNELALAIHQRTGQRKTLAEKISEKRMKSYEKLRKRHNGLAVAKLRVDRCMGCRLTVSASEVNQA